MMGLFSRKEKKIEKALGEYFSLISAYQPVFSSYEGGIYEMELTRAAIHTFATHCSKLKPEVVGAASSTLGRLLAFQPNPLMDTKKYLYRLATAYQVDNNVIIAPVEDKWGNIRGFYPMVVSKVEFVEYEKVIYCRYSMGPGEYFAVEFDRCGVMNQYQYKNETWGENNFCLRPTLELINAQNQGIINGIKNSATIRFIAKLVQPLKPKDLEKEREYFNNAYLSSSNSSGAMVIDQKYQDVKQIDSRPVNVSPAQMDHIRQNVFSYFGTNEKILQNSFSAEDWNAYYEGKIEAFGLEAGLVHTNMVYTDREKTFGNQIFFSSNRLQYASLSDKINFVKEFGDRGGLSINEAREVFNMPPVEGGDVRFIRGEYKPVDSYSEVQSAADGALSQLPAADEGGSSTDDSGNDDDDDSGKGETDDGD